MTLPHVELGNTASDVGQGINSFASGLLSQRARQQQLALQEALAASKQAMDQATTQHIQAQTEQQLPAQVAQTQAQTADLNAQAAGRGSENLPADDNDEAILRQVDPDAPPGIYKGMTKAQAAEHTKVIADYNATKQRMAAINNRFYGRGQITTDVNGNSVLVNPNQPGGGTPIPLGTNPGTGVPLGKPTTSTDRNMAGAGQAALSAHQDLMNYEQNPHIRNEIAKAIALPNIGRIVPFAPGEGLSRMLQSFRLAGVSPEAQAYLKRMFDFAGIIGPKRYGLRGMQSEVTLQQLWTDFGLGQFDLSDQGVQAAERNRENSIRQMQEAAGPNAWSQSQNVFPQTQSPLGTTQVSPYGYQKR